MNTKLSPDERADMVLKQLTLDEKITLLHGNGMPGWGKPRANAYWATAVRGCARHTAAGYPYDSDE
jgi:beta-glucosidase